MLSMVRFKIIMTDNFLGVNKELVTYKIVQLVNYTIKKKHF